MMRFTIVGLAVVFFSLSVVIIFKAFGLSVQEISYQAEKKDVMTESNDAIKRLAESQDANKAIVADLQATIARLEDKLIEKEKSQEVIETTDVENRLKEIDLKKIDSKPRTLGVFGGGTFKSGRDVISDIDFSTIENMVKEISAYPSSRIIIEGHTDSIPTKTTTGMQYRDNMGLSLLRARAIANILVRHGISLDRMSIVGYGDTRPVSSNKTEEGRAKNRRVEVKLKFEEEDS
ncbi:MAG: OmpA family protein [Nitrosomonas sp.]|nr:OmpA family protein [Nitrosomonas sp.]